VLGVIAFEGGNLSGAGLGLAAVTGFDETLLSMAVAVLAGMLLCFGRYRLLERVLVVCVALMGIVFLVTAVMVGPSWRTLLSGLLLPSVPRGSTLTILALIGTTVVPYNLFLYASTVRARWQKPDELGEMRRDLVLAVAIGGVISTAIVVTAAAAVGEGEVSSAADMARQLEPLLGSWARTAFGLGIALAGISSAITAPLAAAYILSGLLKQGPDLTGPVARLTTLGCVFIGAGLVLTGIRPVQLILFAQAANGLILPVVAAALLLVLNDRIRLRGHANGWPGNVLGALVVAVCLLLAARIWML
jgi:Mn2+/Fe2+ NRAMP family transporter